MGIYGYVVTIQPVTYLDRQPLHNIQDILHNLGRNVFFTVLDQSKIYQQRHMEKEPRYLTALITPWDFMGTLYYTLGVGTFNFWIINTTAVFRVIWRIV